MRPIWKILILAVPLLAGCTLLFAFRPEQVTWIPQCPFYALTGYQCAGCGTLRAIHCLLHLQFGQAWAYNPFMILTIPYLFVLALLWILPEKHLPKLRFFAYHHVTIYVFLGLLFLWWVGRNLF